MLPEGKKNNKEYMEVRTTPKRLPGYRCTLTAYLGCVPQFPEFGPEVLAKSRNGRWVEELGFSLDYGRKGSYTPTCTNS